MAGSTLFSEAISQAIARIRCAWIRRKKAIVLHPEVDQDRAALEKLHLVVPIGRNLAERLLAEIFRRPRLGHVEQADPVGAPDLLQRPADAKVSHQALGEVRNPAIGRDFRSGSRVRLAWRAP